jgi:hypothetical protein
MDIITVEVTTMINRLIFYVYDRVISSRVNLIDKDTLNILDYLKNRTQNLRNTT